MVYAPLACDHMIHYVAIHKKGIIVSSNK